MVHNDSGSVGMLPPPPAWHGNKSVFSSSEVDLSAKLMIMITVHEKSICRGEPEEKNPAVGGMGEGNQSTGLPSV